MAAGLPTADAIANAALIAAAHTGELAQLERAPASMLRGQRHFKGRWLVFYAMMCAGVPWHVAAPLCGISKRVRRDALRGVLIQPWWDWAVAERLTTLLAGSMP